jgi:hypothetical protein
MSSAQNLTSLNTTQRLVISRNTNGAQSVKDVPDRLINAHEAALIAHRKEVTIYNAANPKVGKLHPVRDQHGHVLFSEKEVRDVYGDSSVDRRRVQHSYVAPIIQPNDPKDFNSVMLREYDSLLADISVKEATIVSLKKKLALLEPLVAEIRK